MSIRANTDRTRLNERVYFERLVNLQDETTGRITKVWTSLRDNGFWAAVDGKKASDRNQEPQQAGSAQSMSEYTVWVRSDVVQRYSVGVVDRMRWKGRVFNIRDIPDQQLRGRLIAIFCTVNLTESAVADSEIIIDGGGDS